MTGADEAAALAVVVEDQGVAGRPVAMLEGTFSLYELDDGGLMLATYVEGRGVEQRVIPGKVLRMVTSGPMAKMFGSIFGGGE